MDFSQPRTKKNIPASVSQKSRGPDPYADQDTYSYKGWMTSDFFWKRVLGIWGYYVIGYLTLLLLVFFLAMFFIIFEELFLI